MSPELKVLGSLSNQTVNQQTDAKTLHYSLLKLKYSPYLYTKKTKKNSHPQKSHEQDILPKIFKPIDHSLCPAGCMP